MTASDFFANLSASQRIRKSTKPLPEPLKPKIPAMLTTAIMHYDSIIDLDNHNLDARFKLGQLYESKNMFDEATFEYEQAISIDKNARYKELPLRLGNLHIAKVRSSKRLTPLILRRGISPPMWIF